MELTKVAIPQLDDGGPKDHPFRPIPESFLERPVFEVFQEIAQEFPSAVALRTSSAVVPYGELLDRVQAIASRLMAEGQPGEPVALALSVDWHYPAAMLACLAAGRPYVPLDLRHPAGRLSWILEHSGASVVLTQGASQRIPLSGHCRSIDLDELHDTSTRFQPLGNPGSVAYIVYTSGSTGRPKGVFQDQRGLMHDVLQYTNSTHLGREDVSSLLYSPSVNGSLRDIYGTLLNGACLCMGDLAGEGFQPVIDRSSRCGITLLHAMPPVLRSLLREPGAGEMLRKVRLAYVAGDRFLTSDVRLLRGALPPDAYLYTGIGSTECATLYRQWFVPKDWPLEKCAVLPVGRALPGREVRIYSEEGEELGTGETGTLHVRGRYMSRGYWRDPELTDRSFTGPSEPGAFRVFRTGDLGRLLEDGLLEFVGRGDRQVKIRGLRVDPSETEAVLRSLPGMEEAAVLVVELHGVNRLVACVQVSEVGALEETAIVGHLQSRLPSHLVPSRVLVSNRLPRLPNIKLDQVALKNWAEAMLQEPGKSVATPPVEAGIGELSAGEALPVVILREWEKVLGRTLSGTDVRWQKAGGDSLQALAVLSAVERRVGRRLTTELIHGDATPASMAADLVRSAVLPSEGVQLTPRIPGKLWVISSLANVSVHDRRLVELLADVVEGDVLHITSVDDELERLRSIRELAENCVSTLVSKSERGTPVYLMGLSFGARVAFEMAALLEDRGFPVRFLGIGDIPVDARATRVENGPPFRGSAGAEPIGWGLHCLRALKAIAKRAAINVVEWLTIHRSQWALRWYMRAGRTVLGEGFTVLSSLALRRGQAALWKPAFFDGQVTLFVSTARGKALSGLSPTFGWEHQAASVVRVDVDGTHETYHRDDNAAGLTRAIRARLRPS